MEKNRRRKNSKFQSEKNSKLSEKLRREQSREEKSPVGIRNINIKIKILVIMKSNGMRNERV